MQNSPSLISSSAIELPQPLSSSIEHQPLPSGPPFSSYDRHHSSQEFQLYQEFQPLVRRLLHRYGTTPALREELIGELYCRFASLLAAYDPERGVPLRAYLVRQLCASAYTYARSQWRYDRRTFRVGPLSDWNSFTTVEDSIPEWHRRLDLTEVADLLPQALEQLSLRQRQVVLWRFYDGLSFGQIAQQLGVQEATARSHCRHGLNKLREELRERDLFED